ncbi:MAG: shikimate dehydrogenase [Sphaerochaetaceae bacterium]|nr:shikimate dehydrogenase [Sphaerochaetaceae bacterium]
MKTVSGKTDIYAILGNPIAHSMSPVIMNKNFARKNMDKIFLALRADLSDFDTVFPVLCKLNFAGYVFTMPVKEIAVHYMDELSKEAEIIGAVNCVVNNGGRLIGYNTDSIGFWNAVQEANEKKIDINKVFVLGCGGFSRSAITQAALQGVRKIVVANRFSDTAFITSFNEFKDRLLKAVDGVELQLIDWKPEEWSEYLKDVDLVANGTPNGMKDVGDLHEIFPYEAVKKDAIFFDAIYIPKMTKNLMRAQEFGHITVEGINLLVHQGAVSFKNWTGEIVSPSVMKEDILNFWNNN